MFVFNIVWKSTASNSACHSQKIKAHISQPGTNLYVKLCTKRSKLSDLQDSDLRLISLRREMCLVFMVTEWWSLVAVSDVAKFDLVE